MTPTTGAATPATEAAPPLRGGHILIVDDNAINRTVLTRALNDLGHAVATAENGQEGLDLLRAQRPLHDVVLLDIMMPVLDGFQTLERIKADPALRDVPVVMISSVDETDAVIRCIRIGASDYIPKPFNVALLRALSNRINALLAAKRAQQREASYAHAMEDLAETVSQLELGRPAPPRLGEIGARHDALGRLARAVERLAREAARRPG